MTALAFHKIVEVMRQVNKFNGGFLAKGEAKTENVSEFRERIETTTSATPAGYPNRWATRTPRDRFSKDPVTYRARKAILEPMIRLSWKAAFLTSSRYKER